MNDNWPGSRENWEKNKKYYLFCKCCGLILAPLLVEGYSIEGDFGYCYGCSVFFYEKFGFRYRVVTENLLNINHHPEGLKEEEGFVKWDLFTLKDWKEGFKI